MCFLIWKDWYPSKYDDLSTVLTQVWYVGMGTWEHDNILQTSSLWEKIENQRKLAGVETSFGAYILGKVIRGWLEYHDQVIDKVHQLAAISENTRVCYSQIWKSISWMNRKEGFLDLAVHIVSTWWPNDNKNGDSTRTRCNNSPESKFRFNLTHECIGWTTEIRQ